jgi:hypothetical protein
MRNPNLAISLSLIVLAAGAFIAVEVFHPAHSPNGWILAGIIFGAYGLMVFVFEAFSHE